MQYPLNQSQLGIYYASQMADEGSNYTICSLFRLPQVTDLNRLARALEKAVLAHPHLLDTIRINENDNQDVVWVTPDKLLYSQTIEDIADIEDKTGSFGPNMELIGGRLFRFDLLRSKSGNYLCLNIHHILIDGVSINAFLEDISKAYIGEDLEAETITACVLNEQEATLRATTTYEEQKKWYETTYGSIEGVSLPLKVNKSTSQQVESRKYNSIEIPLTVDKEAIGALCKKMGVGQSVPYTAAFALTLAAYTGEEDVSYATFYHGRSKEQMRTTSMMVRTLPMVHHLSGMTTVEDLIKQTHQLLQDVREKSLVGFGEICQMSGINGDVSFIYQGRITDGILMLDREETHWQLLSKHEPGMKLSVQVREYASGLCLHITYPTDLYNEAWAKDFGATYTHILSQLNYTKQLADIAPATPEQIAVLDGFNTLHGAPVHVGNEETIVSAFKAAAAQWSDHIAVAYEGRAYTYQELDEMTDALAAMIGEKAMMGNDRREGESPVVSVLIHRNEQMTIWPLAILKAGCAYQPLDSSYPKERLNYMVKDAGAALVVADEGLKPLLDEFEGEFIPSDELKVNQSTSQQVNKMKGSDVMVLLYTSGSTGVPKGVMLSHKNVLTYSRWCQRELDINSEAHVAAYASFGFDANLMDQYPTLLAGGSLYIIPEEIRLDLEAIKDFFERNGITNTIMTTQVAQQFAASYGEVHGLKHLVLGGEKMMSMELPHGYTMHNMYGPTECTVAVTHKAVMENEENIPIGLPTAASDLYIVDKHMHRLPVGAPGELLISGEQVGLGYLNQPEKTAQAFVEWQGKRVYRTGDIVRYRAEGEIEFVGRRDGQVKIRGFRIELKEVEAVIHEMDGISDVTVQAYDLPEGGKYLVAFYVADQPMNTTEIAQYIRDRKPPYMVPACMMQLEKIPLNVNQKVDKKALKAMMGEVKGEGSEVKGEGERVKLNILEEHLMDLFDKCIHQRDFSISTPLIYIGMSSIAAMKVATAIYKEYDVSLDVKRLIKDMSLQDIENEIIAKMMMGEKAPESNEQIEEQKIYPLTGAQKGVYLDWEANRTALQYNVPMVIRLKHVNLPTLEHALKAVIKAHPALQIQLVHHDTGEVMMHTVETALTIDQIDTTECLEANDMHQYMRPFQLLDGPLYHLVLVKDPQYSWLMIDIHHIIYDGLSAGVLLQELEKAYDGGTLTDETYSLLHFAADETNIRQSSQYEEAKTYFDGLIDDIDITHYPESEKGDSELRMVGHTYASIDRQKIEQACQKMGITGNSYFASILSEVLHRMTREERVLFTTISNGRSNMKMMETIGMFVQTLLVQDTTVKATVFERMQAMHNQLQQTLQRDFYSFSDIASAHHITPQVMYAFQDGVMRDQITFGGQVNPIYTLDIETAKVPLSIQINGDTTHFIIEAEYDASIYNKKDMQCLCDMMAVLSEQATNIDLPVSKLSMVQTSQQPIIINRSYGGKMDYDRDRTLVDWVQHYAKTQPDHIAVVDYCSELSYAELDHRTDLLGRMLRQKGVTKDTIVSIMLPRIKEFMVSYLAIHKAGGAYVPLDSEYPNERLIYMLENSESKVLITTRTLAEQKQREGDFPAPEMIFIDEIDWNQSVPAINFAEKDGLAYMIYTSGSTGKPKGVMLEHHNLMAFANWRTNAYVPAGTDHQFICHPSFSFDASICDGILPLFKGCTIHILHEDLRKDLDGLAEYICQHHITGGSFSTQLAMALINHKDLPLSYIEMGGEKLVPTTPRSYTKVNAYGPTEFTCCSSYHIVKNGETDIPIGRPAPNTWSVIVDTEGHLMPWGMPGELCLIGDQIARGYWHLPEKTASVFTPCSFLPGERMYHTGDLAKYNEEGELLYLGRIDHQVKLRGFRIEMGEIEARMASFKDVTGAIAMVQEIAGTKHLVGYFTATTPIDSEQMKMHLSQALTAYMVPDALVQLPAFPLTPNGKIDRKQLPIPTLERSVEYIAPRTELEKQICAIFARITGAQEVGIKDDFFEIGGSSLLAIKAVIELTNLGEKVVYGDLFKLKTPEALAAHINPSVSQTQEENKYYRFDDYNYEAIDALLKENHLPKEEMILRPLGNVLLTGATGYLGMHMLDYLIKETNSTIYCLVRPQGKMRGESRLKTLMVYYLTETHEEQLGKRIHVLEDDITGGSLADTLKNIAIDTIFNCAAMVKHFVVGHEMDEVNVDGVANLIQIAHEKKARLIHVSTYSTAGFVPATYLTLYNEQQLHIGQCTDNEYIRTKYLSERLMLQAIADCKIDGKVMRVGNLMARAEDGEFQINMHSNAFLNNLKSLKVLGKITADMMAAPIEMSPIDCVAAAIGQLATTPENMVLFHPFNNYSSSRTVIVDAMREIGYPIELVTPGEFGQSLKEALQDETKSEDMQGIIHYTMNIENGLAPLGATNFYTTQVLLWLGFRWPMTTRAYVLQLLHQLDSLAFFE